MLIPIIGSAFYVWEGYFHRNPKTQVSESCFFMPCSPQSIKDDDQIYALLAGVFLFVGLEGLPPAFKYLRRRYRETRRFVQLVERTLREFEMRRIVRARPEAEHN